ncbi:MAG: hypothetical protein DPW16_20035 [Chloroflexi bacterium]|nr:hypothetical protein [Chloroflexota bacterium]
MSQTFDLALACDLKPDTPQQVLDTLHYMIRKENYEFHNPPNHPFFAEPSYWKSWFTYSINLFPGEYGAVLRNAEVYYGLPSGEFPMTRITFSVRVGVHDDVFYEAIDLFLDWLAGHSETQGFVGYYQGNYADHPTLIYFKDGKAWIMRVKGEPSLITLPTDDF